MWTKEIPKTPGWYWRSAENGSRPEAVELKHINGRIEERDGYLLEDFNFRWALMESPEDAAARNIGLGLAFVGYYYIGESIGALALVPVLVEETERSYNAGFEAGRETTLNAMAWGELARDLVDAQARVKWLEEKLKSATEK